jgi:curved DNA-binding protein CbpA
MGNNSTKQQNYQQYYNNIQQPDVNQIDLNTLDPYKVLNVPKKFTWEQLKEAYKEAAMKTHPDKGGNKVIFDFVTSCFKTLAKEYKAKHANRNHHELKQESKQYFEKIVNNNLPHPSDVNEPFEKKFNKAFDECRYHDEEIEYGYGEMMSKSEKTREDIPIENVFNKQKVDNGTFNELFNKKVPVSKEIIKYKEPEALPMAKQLQFTEIGKKRPDDYSSGVEQKNLTYTDYMKAHNGMRLINPEQVNRKDFKSVEEYEKYRDNKIKKGLTEKEKKYIEKQKELEEQKEFERLERLKQQELAIQRAHEKATRLLIK